MGNFDLVEINLILIYHLLKPLKISMHGIRYEIIAINSVKEHKITENRYNFINNLIYYVLYLILWNLENLLMHY